MEKIVYLQRSKLRNIEKFTLEAPRESKLMIDFTIHEPISISGNPESPKSSYLSIALRKQTRSCILHSIPKIVLYNTIFSRFHVFTTNLDITNIPRNIHEALKILE